MNISLKENTLIFLILLTTSIFGQETTNQNDSVKQTYVNSLSGIEIKIDGFSHGYHSGSTISPLLFNYIKEKSLFKTTSIIFRGGFIIIPKSFEQSWKSTIIYNPVIKGDLYYLNFALNFEVEPRWYWGIKERTLKGKATLNSGWFLSLPFLATIPFDISYNTIPDGYDLSLFHDYSWFKDYLRIYFNTGPSVGYRFSPLENCYLEGIIQIIVQNYNIREFENNWFGTPNIQPQFKISGAYIFKDSIKRRRSLL